MNKLKIYWIYLVIILIILSLYFQLSGTTFEGLELTEPKTETTTSSTDLFDDNQHLYNSFKSYNTAYSNYVKCVENTYNPNTTPQYDSSYNNSTFSSTACAKPAQNLNTSYTDLITQISKVNSTASEIQGNLNSIDDIKKNQYNNQTLRSELDLKLQDLYSIQNSLPDMNQKSVDSTTFAFLLWSILASSMLLYVFTRSTNNNTSSQ